jgi:C4-dicarboxylate-specific signal transduction histidine kinase
MADGKESSGPEQQELFRHQRAADPGTAQRHARSHMLGKATHEIYNSSTFLVANLTTLRGDLLAGEVDLELAVEMLDECLEGMGRTTDVLRRVRELSRESKKPSLEPLDLAAAAAQVCRSFQERRGLELQTDMESAQIRASLDLLAYVIEQMIGVWLRRLPALEGSVGLGILLRVRRVDGGGRLEVRDTRPHEGDAIDPELFDAFRQGDATEDGTRLFVSRTMIEDMGGRIEAVMDGGHPVLALVLPHA